MSDERVTARVPASEQGQRLDRFLTGVLADHTRSSLGRLIRDGAVTIDGQPATKAGMSLNQGMRVEIVVPAQPAQTLVAENIPLSVLHEDDDLIVVDKASGMIVHPGHGRRDGSLVHALLGRGVRLAAAGAPQRPGIVHRLDLDTSGVMVVAKNDEAYHKLSSAFADHAVKKRYLALVWGHPDPPQGVIERPIGRSRANPTRMTAEGSRGKSRAATTRFRTLETLPGFALLECRPRSGRTHQIRVHLQSIRHPILGDTLYGGAAYQGVQDPRKRKALREFGRLGLHAAELTFDHPQSGRPVRFVAPMPATFDGLLRELREV